MPNDPTLSEFIEARIAVDEIAARKATAGPWRYDPTKVNAVDRGEAVFAGKAGASAITVASTGPADDQQSMSDAKHIARHDPARVLAECEAKRRIVAVHALGEPWDEAIGEVLGSCATCDYQTETWPCATLRLLALPYANHPDYRPGWSA